MSQGPAVVVTCRGAPGGWRCTVVVGTDAAATTHQVSLTDADLQRLRPGSDTPDQLLRDSFAFLLAREPRESILRSFDLTVIGRYFPDWEAQIRAGSSEF